MGRVWLVTGASSGLGRAIAEAALERGDDVVGASRRTGLLDDLAARYPGRLEQVELDVTDTVAGADVVRAVEARHGRLDVLVNNAGRGQLGAAEATTDEELRALFDVHVFGPAALVRAALPGMRARRSGAVVQMSSFGGQVAYPGFSAYGGTKFALEGYSEALAGEVRPHGIKVLVVEPGNFRTGLLGGAMVQSTVMPEYEDAIGPTREMTGSMDGAQPGDPARAAAVILQALDAETTPLRLPLGDEAVDGILAHLHAVEAEVRAWEHVTRPTSFTG